MRKIQFRSGKRVVSISVDDEIVDFLDKQPNKSKFVCDLVKKAMAQQTEEPEQLEPQPQPEWTEQISILMNKRSRFVTRYGEKFLNLERQWLHLHWSDLNSYEGEDENVKEALATFPQEVKDYLDETLNTVRGAQFEYEFVKAVEEQSRIDFHDCLVEYYGGEPDEPVYKGLTRSKIMDSFQRDKHYTVMDVASRLSISYDHAYKHIVPWLKAHGYQVKSEEKSENEEIIY